MNRAVDGDIVAVEILPEDEWTAPSGVVLEDQAEQDPGMKLHKPENFAVTSCYSTTLDDEIDEEEIIKNSRKSNDRQPTGTIAKGIAIVVILQSVCLGRIVGIIRRKWRQYCGILLPSVLPESTRHLFAPAERKIPKIRIETRQAAALASQKIIVAIDSWPRTSRYPQGHFVRSLGEIGDKNTENEVLRLTRPFEAFFKFSCVIFRFCFWSTMCLTIVSPKRC